jgi:oligosaccharyltransferase complex subunit gamma
MDKLQKQLSKDGSVLQLDSQAFKLYTEEPRNYSLVVMFTALDSSVGCEPCWKLKPEFDLVAADFYSKVGRQSEEGKKLFFCSLDFMNGRDAFLSMGLKSAPIVMHFGPTDGEGSKATPDRWDIQE